VCAKRDKYFFDPFKIQRDVFRFKIFPICIDIEIIFVNDVKWVWCELMLFTVKNVIVTYIK